MNCTQKTERLEQPAFDFASNPVFKTQGQISQLQFVKAEVMLHRLGKQGSKGKLNAGVSTGVFCWCLFVYYITIPKSMQMHYSFECKA